MKKLALAIAAAACSCSPYSISGATTPTMMAFGPSRAQEVGTVCVIRWSTWARAVTFVVHDNQTLVGATKGNSYFCYEAAPGEHNRERHVRLGRSSGAHVDLDRRGDAVLAVAGIANSFGSVTSRLVWIDQGTARELATGAEYRVLTDTPGHEQVPAGVPFAPAADQVAAGPRPMP